MSEERTGYLNVWHDENGTHATTNVPKWRAWFPDRVRVAWSVLRGYPVAYRLTVHGGLVFNSGAHAQIVETGIWPDAVAKAAVWVDGLEGDLDE